MTSIIVNILSDLKRYQNRDAFFQQSLFIRKKLNELNEFIVRFIDPIYKKEFHFYRYHYHKLNSYYYRQLQQTEKAKIEAEISAQHKHSADYFDLRVLDDLDCLKQPDGFHSEKTDDSQMRESINSLGSLELSIVYDVLFSSVESPEDFVKHYHAYKYLNNALNDMRNISNNASLLPQILELHDYIKIWNMYVRKRFIEHISKYDASRKELYLFDNCIAVDSVQKRLRDLALALQVEPRHDDYNLYCQTIVPVTLISKKIVIQTSESNDKLFDYFSEAMTLYSLGKSQQKLVHFERAYEKFKSACWVANALRLQAKMLECRIYMAACLLLSYKAFEAKLVALAGCMLTNNPLYDYNELDKQRALKLLILVYKRYQNPLILYLSAKRGTTTEDNRVDPISQKIDLYMDLTKYIAINVDNAVYSTCNIAFTRILRDPAQVGTIFCVRTSVPVTQNQKQHSTVRNLLSILTRAEKQFYAGDFFAFFITLNEKYHKNQSLIKTNFSEKSWDIQSNEIKRTLSNHGFTPDSIAYLLLLIFEALTQGIYTVDVPIQWFFFAKHLLDSILLSHDLEAQALELDKKQFELKRARSSSLNTKAIKKKSNKTNLVKMRNGTYEAKFKQVKKIALINRLVFALAISEPISPELINLMKKSFDLDHGYFEAVFLRLEIAKDFLWLYTHDETLLNFLYFSIPTRASFIEHSTPASRRIVKSSSISETDDECEWAAFSSSNENTAKKKKITSCFN